MSNERISVSVKPWHETGVRTGSWTTMGSERSREICFHRKKSMQP